MKLKKEFIKFYYYFIASGIIIVALFIGIAYAVNSVNEGYQSTAGSTQTIDAHDICKKVVNSGSNSYFIPTRTAEEWSNFISAAPSLAGISLEECSIGWAITADTPDWEIIRSVQQTSDGGYIVSGYIDSFGGYSDMLLIKLDSSGNVDWARTAGTPDDNDWGYSVQQTSDGGYIVSGYTNSFGAVGYDIFIVKFDSSGNVDWAKTVGGSGQDGGGFSIQQTSDGGYIVSGYTDSFGAGNKDIFLVKLDSNGNVDWAKTVGGSDYDYGYSIQQTSDGGYIVGGTTNGFNVGGYDIFIVKFDSSGNVDWAKTVGGSGYDHGRSIQQTSDGGYIVGGDAKSFGDVFDYDMFIVKLDSSGNVDWAKTVGGLDDDYGYSIQQTSDGGYIVSGYTTSFGVENCDMFIVKLDSSGNVDWTKTVGGSGWDFSESVQQTSDGGYIVGGRISYDIFIVKLDSSGDISDCSYLQSQSVSAQSQSVSAQSQSVSAQSQSVSAQSQSVSAQSQSVSESQLCY